MAKPKVIRTLSDNDLTVFRELYRDNRRRPTNKRIGRHPDPELYTPDIYIVKVPTDGINPRIGAGTTDDPYIMGKGTDCEVYAPEFNPTDDVYELHTVDGLLIDVYNIYPVKWYGAGNPMIEVRREKFGRWLCEKPPFRHIVKPTVDVLPGQTKNAKVWILGSDAGTISVSLDWGHSNQKISANKQAFAYYDVNSSKWRYDGAECET